MMIYFIRGGDYVKIGVADNPWDRLHDFQTGSPIRLELLAVAPGEYDTEAMYHRDFAYCRHKGEWYVHDELIAATIDGVKRNHPKLQDRAEVRRLHKADAGKKKNRRAAALSSVDAVRVVVNTAVVMTEHEPDIDIRSVTEGKRGPGILIWVPGYVHNGDTVIVATSDAPSQEAANATPG